MGWKTKKINVMDFLQKIDMLILTFVWKEQKNFYHIDSYLISMWYRFEKLKIKWLCFDI